MPFKNDTDTVDLLLDSMDMILDITGEVYSVIEEVNADNNDFDNDTFSLCCMAIDFGIIQTVTAILAATGTAREAKIKMGVMGNVSMEGETLDSVFPGQQIVTATPTPAFIQVGMAVKVASLAPSISGFIRDTVGGIKEFAEKEPPKKVEAY